MKRFLLTLAAILTMAGHVTAQSYEKNLWGIRAGLNVSNISIQYYPTTSKAGFHVAGVYQRLLSKSHPLYLETGLQISQKGCKFFNYNNDDAKNNMTYLQIPLMLNYKFTMSDIITLYPSLGVYYAIGLGGKYTSQVDPSVEYKLFGDEGDFKRSDFGIRLSGTMDYKHISFSLGYEFGVMNITGPYEIGEYYGIKTKNGNFFISIGYNF